MKLTIIIAVGVAAVVSGLIYLQGAFHWYTVPIQLAASFFGVTIGRMASRRFR